jgi:hypothetical protein
MGASLVLWEESLAATVNPMKLHNRLALLLQAALVGLAWMPAPGLGASDPSGQCDQAAAQASKDSGVPINILLAITRVETGRGAPDLRPWPWTINADGAGAWYDTKDQAIDAAMAHQSDGTGTFDVGCFQLNIKWHGDKFTSLSDMFDPAQNAAQAAAFLAQLYQESGDWATAVASYHSRTPDLAKTYLAKVKQVLNDPGTAIPVAAPDPDLHENLFPLLQAGDPGSAGSIVPLFSARNPIIGSKS